LPAHFAHKRARPRACRQEAAFNVMTGFDRRISGQRSMAPGAGKCPEWQRELTVNQPSYDFEGSSPSFPTTLRPDGLRVAQPRGTPGRSVSGVAGAQRKRRRTVSWDSGCAWCSRAPRSSASSGARRSCRDEPGPPNRSVSGFLRRIATCPADSLDDACFGRCCPDGPVPGDRRTDGAGGARYTAKNRLDHVEELRSCRKRRCLDV
jgi:hypothetical protein